jgi:flagellar protein FlaG
MDIISLNQGTPTPSAPAPATSTPVDKASQNREVVQAVKALNGSQMFGEDNELMFQQDRQTHRMVVRVVNRQTQELVSQIPAEYVLRLADDGQQNRGSL